MNNLGGWHSQTQTVLLSQVVVQLVSMTEKERHLLRLFFVSFLIVFFPCLEWYVVATPSTSESLVGQQDQGSSTVSWCYTPLQDSHLDSPSCIPSPREAQPLLMATEWKGVKVFGRVLTENQWHERWFAARNVHINPDVIKFNQTLNNLVYESF